jgi:Tol biopolymer transport system component
MSNKSAFLAVLGFLVAAVVLGAFPQIGEDLFQKALRLETNEGKWLEAITLYQAILKQSPEDRQLAAEAQFRIGLCFERLGNEKAQNAYQAVIQDYGEQKDVVAKAKDRLSKLARPSEKPEEPEGIRIKQVWKKPYTDSLGSISPDGRFLGYVHWGEGDLAIHDLVTGEDRILTHDADVNKGFAQEPEFSRNGKQIAYSWWNANHTYDLLVVDVDHPSPRRLYRQEGEHVYPATWLSDDELIFTRDDQETKIGQVCSLAIPSGAIRVLKAYERRAWPQLSGSPDGKYVAIDFANETDKGNFDIDILTKDGSAEVPLIRHPANDRVLGWVPGRKEFLFTSDRSGTWDLWAIPVDNGKPSGPAKRIYTDIGAVRPVGFSQNGDCFVGFSRRNFNALLAPFDPGTGELKEKSAKDLLGSNYGIGWSPDGRSLSYIKMGSNADNPMQLTIQDSIAGEERRLADNLMLTQSPCWSPDGNSLLAIGFEKSDRAKSAGIYSVDVQTGQTTQILNLLDYKNTITPPGDDAFPLSDVQWSLNGKSIFYLFFTDRLVKRDLATGEEKILFKHSRFERSVLARSPDGRNLLFAVRSPEDKKSHLYTIPAEGGNTKELCTAQEANNIGMGMWSPDGKYIYFTEVKDGGTSLWRIPAAGGTPQKTWQSKDRAEIFSFHPDGKQIAVAIYVMELEIRVIKNLVRELEKLNKISK